MKARDLAALLLRHPEAEVLVHTTAPYATEPSGRYATGILLDPSAEDENVLLLCGYRDQFTTKEQFTEYWGEHHPALEAGV